MRSKGVSVFVKLIDLPPDTFLRVAGRDLPWIGVDVDGARYHGPKTPVQPIAAEYQVPHTISVTMSFAPLRVEVVVVRIGKSSIARLYGILPEDEGDHIIISRYP